MNLRLGLIGPLQLIYLKIIFDWISYLNNLALARIVSVPIYSFRWYPQMFNSLFLTFEAV